MEKINMLIDGEWISGSQWIDVRDPATSDVIAQIVRGNETHVDEAVVAARLALKSKEWKAFKPFQRGQLLVELASYIRLHAEELAALESLDVGKPMNQARADVEAAARYFEFYGGIADKVFGAM